MPQDYSLQHLRGHSFKGQELTDADFSGADIKGADFSNANLKNAKFIGAKAGLQTRWAIILTALLFFLAIISGIAFGHASTIVIIYSKSKYANIPTVFIVFIIFLIVTIQKGFTTALSVTALTVAGAFIVVQFMVFGLIGDSSISKIFEQSTWGAAGFSAWAVTGAMTLVLVVTIFAIILSSLSCVHLGSNKNLTEMLLVRCVAVVLTVVIAIAGTIVLAIAETKFYSVLWTLPKTWVYALSMESLSAYVAWRVLCGDEKLAWIQRIAIAFAASGGTSFRNANLTDADFAQATLKSTDFRKANLTRTCFKKTKKLDLVRPGETYLQSTELRELLVTGQGQGKNFDRQNLRGVNLQSANLQDASFISADLSEANLQDADLSRAKLVQTQLDGTDFTGATLTGAYIEDWNITTDTKFGGVRCECVYMRLPTKDNPDPHRKPDNRQEVFADGEFGDFIKPIFDTLDLYHNQGVDPRAIAISFKQLAENHPEADLRIVGMEVKGEDKFLLRAKTASTADKSELSAEYFNTYNEIRGLPEREIKLLLEEKDSRIRSLENFVNQALQRPSFYSNVEQVGFMTNNPGGFSVGGSVGGNVNNVQGDNNRAVQGDNNQGVLGDNNQVTQQNQVGAASGKSLTKDDVVKLLAQLETLIQGAELPADTKEEVVEDLSAAKKATDKEEPNKQRALERLGTVAETLEKTSKTVDAGQKIWTTAKPIIVKVASWLGAAAGSHLLGL